MQNAYKSGKLDKISLAYSSVRDLVWQDPRRAQFYGKTPNAAASWAGRRLLICSDVIRGGMSGRNSEMIKENPSVS